MPDQEGSEGGCEKAVGSPGEGAGETAAEPVDFFEQAREVARRAGYGTGVGKNTHGEFAARSPEEVWHGQAVGQDSLGTGAAEALEAVAEEALADAETGEPDMAEAPVLPESLVQTYAHINSQPEDPALLAQLSPTNLKYRLKYLGPQHEVLARLFAAGMSVAEVSRAMGRYSQTRLSTIRNSPRFIARVQQIQESSFGQGIEGRMKRIGVRALDVAEDMIAPTSTATKDLQFKVAKDMLDRAYGKPKETVKVESNTVVDLFAALDQMKRGGEGVSLAALFKAQPRDNPVDAWVESVVPESAGIGEAQATGDEK